MATLGYCSECGLLVGIVPREHMAPASRAKNWYPLPHFCKDGKTLCTGDKAPAGRDRDDVKPDKS